MEMTLQAGSKATAGSSARFDPITVRIPVAVRMTGIGRSKLYELIKAGDVEVVKVGTSTLIKVASLRRLLGTP
jgi:hypothetical protein